MKPMEQGRYCGHCSKVVTDFTGKTDKEIADFFKHRPQQVCGRFDNRQLQKTYSTPAVQVLPAHRRLARYLLGMLLTGAAAEKAGAQEPVEMVLQKDTLLKDSALTLVPATLPDSLAMCDDTTQASLPTDSLAADSLKITWYWKGGISMPIFTDTFSITLVTTGMVSVMPAERRTPLNYLLDSLELIARKMRLMRAAGRVSAPVALTEFSLNKPRDPRRAPMKHSVPEAIMPATIDWKPKKGKRVKK